MNHIILTSIPIIKDLLTSKSVTSQCAGPMLGTDLYRLAIVSDSQFVCSLDNMEKANT